MERELGDLLQQVHRIMAPADEADGSRISDLSGSQRWLFGSFPSFFRLFGLEVYSEVAWITGVRGKYVAAPPIGTPWSLIRKWLHSTTTAKPSCSRPGLGKRVANLLV